MGEVLYGLESRRRFIGRASVAALALPFLPLVAASCAKTGDVGAVAVPAQAAQGECEWCGAADAPRELSWRTDVVPAGEPGERLVVSGTVFRPDGVTPAADVLVYAYGTDARGYYRRAHHNDHRHGRMRAWMRTDARGRYELHTIKPGPYPGRPDPAHIHYTLTGPDFPEYYIDDVWFEGDPRITPAERDGRSGRGGFNAILDLKRDGAGAWRGVRDIRLERV
jgi:protocatechuate 3,4-dioxygenase, beta subunit